MIDTWFVRTQIQMTVWLKIQQMPTLQFQKRSKAQRYGWYMYYSSYKLTIFLIPLKRERERESKNLI